MSTRNLAQQENVRGQIHAAIGMHLLTITCVHVSILKKNCALNFLLFLMLRVWRNIDL